jgi:hypothetical protein
MVNQSFPTRARRTNTAGRLRYISIPGKKQHGNLLPHKTINKNLFYAFAK